MFRATYRILNEGNNKVVEFQKSPETVNPKRDLTIDCETPLPTIQVARSYLDMTD